MMHRSGVVRKGDLLDNFHLAPHSYVFAIEQDDKKDPGLQDLPLIISNNGNVEIDVEIINSTVNGVTEKPIVRNVKPQRAMQYHDTNDYAKTVLKVSNRSDEEAIFSAEGGTLVAEDLVSTVKQMVF